MGLENIKHTPIRYSRIRKRPYFSSILESTENLLKSCIEEKKKLLDKMNTSNGQTPDIKDIVDCMLLCYLCPELKLQNVSNCKNTYKTIIKNKQEQQIYEEIKEVAARLATDNYYNGSRGALIHVIQSLPRVELLCRDLENNSKSKDKDEIDISIQPNTWKEITAKNRTAEWQKLENVFNMSKISAQSLYNLCKKQVKLFNDSSEGIGYFKDLYSITNKIAEGRIEISEITHKEKDYETNKSKTKTTNKKENDFGNDKSKTTNEGEKNSKRSTFRMSIWKRSSSSKINTTSQHNKSSTQNADKKTSKNSKSRISNIWKRFSGSKTKTKK